MIAFKAFTTKIISFIMALLMLLGVDVSIFKKPDNQWNTNYKYVMVHGLMGWGSYDIQNNIAPYWGMLSGDMLERLSLKGYDCYAASVNPLGSAWDRACELYAQLTGTVVDYGEAHSKKYGHDRYGKDYSCKPLIPSWSEEDKINLVGHSFGGVTVRIFTSILEYGSEEEIAASGDNASDFFEGGKGNMVYSVTTLSAPHNGTSAYESEVWADIDETTLSQVEQALNKVDPTKFIFDMMVGLSCGPDGEILPDTTHYELRIDNAIALNKTIKTVPSVYYFSYATSVTHEDEKGNQVPDYAKVEPLFATRCEGIGKTKFTTPGGVIVDEKWLENDGLVNTYSALAPFDEPQKAYDESSVEKGVWNIMPVIHGDHTYFMGEILMTKDLTDFFNGAYSMINMLG